MIRKKLFIATITFNNFDGLIRTYKSISNLNEDEHLDITWIIVDGASSDGTIEWLKSLKTDLDVTWLSEKDSGIYNAMNKCIKMLPDDNSYTVFMNSGDEFTTSFIDDFAAANTTPTVILGNAFIDPINTQKYLVRSRKPSQAWLGMPTSHQAMFFRNSFLKQVNYDEDFRLSGDYDLYCKAVVISELESIEINRIDSAVCVFYLDGISVKKRIKALSENFKTRRKVLKLNIASCFCLYFLHYAHHYLKLYFPRFTRSIRSRS